MTRDEIIAVYEQGPEAVVALVERLLGLLTNHQEAISTLSARVKELENRLGKDSHNSSKPPSSDGYSKKTVSQRPKSGRKPGGQPGHPGHTLRLSENPDKIIPHEPSHCGACGADLGQAPTGSYTRRQVWDLPPLCLQVTEHRAFTKACPCCGECNQAPFPEEVGLPVQYGPRVKALGVYLHDYHLLPMARTSEMMHDLFGVCLCQGTLLTSVQTCAERLKPIETAIHKALQQAEVAEFDETGLRIEGKLWWLHSASTRQLTYYACHPKRGKQATDAIGILPAFVGIAMHDGYSSYPQYECAHALCNAHHLRELTAVYEQDHQPWAQSMKELLVRIKDAVEATWELGEWCFSPASLCAFEQEYEQILQEGFEANPLPPQSEQPTKRGRPKQSRARNLLDRLDHNRRETLAFMYDFRVPFDNNVAERDLRMMKVHQKIAGCFRTRDGANAFCRIRGYLSTLRKQGQDLLSALQHVFEGEPTRPNYLPV